MTNFTVKFNDKLSRSALDKIHANPELWKPSTFLGFRNPCGTLYCYMGWCDLLSGSSLLGDWEIYQQTKDLIGLDIFDYDEFISSYNSLAKLEALHLFHVTGIFGIEGYDTDGFDRGDRDIDGFDIDGINRHGYNRDGVNTYVDGYLS